MLWNCSKSNLKNMFVQLDHLPRDRDENSKNIYLKPPPRFKLSASEFQFPKSHNALRLSSFREVVLRTSCIRILRPWHQLQNVAKSINPEASIWWSAPVQKAQPSPAKSRMGFLIFLLDSLARFVRLFGASWWDFFGRNHWHLPKAWQSTTDFSNSLTMSSTWWFQPIWKISFPQGWGVKNKICLKPSPSHHVIAKYPKVSWARVDRSYCWWFRNPAITTRDAAKPRK